MAGEWTPVLHIGVAAVVLPLLALLLRGMLRSRGRTLPRWVAALLGGIVGTGAALAAGWELVAVGNRPSAPLLGMACAFVFVAMLGPRPSSD